jgi:hypothetical protein
MPSEISPAAPSRSWIDRGALRQTCARPVVFRSLGVAALIGTILNTINQGSELLAHKHVDAVKILLTYTVPFLVASYGAYCAFRTRRRPGQG